MGADRITQLRLGGVRCIEHVELELGAFTVLAGENGAGKSTIVEACELLRKAATESLFIQRLYQPHDGTRLLRDGASSFSLAARIARAGPPLSYEIQVLRDGSYLTITAETVMDDQGNRLMNRTGASVSCFSSDGQQVLKETAIESGEAALGRARFLNSPEVERVQRALAAIEVHVPLDLRRSWALPSTGTTARSSNNARPVERLDPGGTNLVNAYAKLRNQSNWRETLGRIRLILGDVDDVLIQPDPSGGTLGLAVRWDGGLEIALSGLSDGQVSALALMPSSRCGAKNHPVSS